MIIFSINMASIIMSTILAQIKRFINPFAFALKMRANVTRINNRITTE